MIDIPWLDPHNRTLFPNVDTALRDPDGLLAVGGDLSPERLIAAYQSGIFPWYSEGQPILWWSPDPRLVLFPEKLHVPRSLQKTIRKKPFRITLDTNFTAVIRACAAQRGSAEGTWITAEMAYAYERLHEQGWVHSAEVWQNSQLVGGIYGVAVGKVFFGESMFTEVSDASKVGFVHLVHQLHHRGCRMIDCQVQTEHLSRFGAKLIPRSRFLHHLNDWARDGYADGHWKINDDVMLRVEQTGGRI